MNIRDLLLKYSQQNYNKIDSYNLAAEEIILSKICYSPLCDHVTLKGGIVMFMLTKKQRSVTKDIDFDFVSFPLTENAIKSFVDSLNNNGDDFKVSIGGLFVELKHEDYQGIRVPLLISDTNGDKLLIKIDIGVHTNKEIPQQKIEILKPYSRRPLVLNANPPEQIVAEKLVALARIGERTTRYKDIYDIYFLLANRMVNNLLFKETINIILEKSRKNHRLNISEFKNIIHSVLENKRFEQNFRKAKNQWIKEDYQTMKEYILNFIDIVCYPCTNVCTVIEGQ